MNKVKIPRVSGDKTEDTHMKICPGCNNQVADEAMFCTKCGTQFAQTAQAAPQPNYAPVVDPYDHTAEFDPKDISNNKVVSMLVYLMGWVGIVIALLASNTSKYAAFHVRQALKFVVIETLIPIALGVGAIINIIPFLGWIVYGLAALAAFILAIALQIVRIICFFSICNGKAKEPAIIRGFSFLR